MSLFPTVENWVRVLMPGTWPRDCIGNEASGCRDAAKIKNRAGVERDLVLSHGYLTKGASRFLGGELFW